MATVTFDHMYKRYGEDVIAVNDLNLEVKDGEFLVLALEDVTNRRSSASDLEAIEAYSQDIVDTVREALLVLDEDGRVHAREQLRHVGEYEGVDLWVRVDEDPVTGSAHCTLAPFWQERLGRSELSGYQVSSRGGKVRTRVDGERVKLAGQAVTVLRAELM